MSFRVPDDYSSSPAPSTPDRKANNLFAFGASNPSTTPAGPPPSSAGSFTPAGLPPPSYGGSMFSNTSIKPLSFGHSNSPDFGDSPSSRGFTQSPTGFQSSVLGSKYKPTPQRGFRPPSYDSEEERQEDGIEYAENVDDDQYESEEDGGAHHDNSYEDEEGMEVEQEYSQRSGSEESLGNNEYGRSLISLRESMAQSTAERPKHMAYRSIATELYSQIEPPDVHEADDVVLGTEDIVTRLYREGVGEMTDDESLNEALATIPGDLVKLWNGYQKKTAVREQGEYTTRIGPGPRTSGFTKANFLADLTLHVYHPQVDTKTRDRRLKTLPQTLLEWLNEHHDPYPSQLEEIAAHRPTPANHRLFWETIFNNMLRGKLSAVVQLLKNGGWRHARGGRDEIQSQNGQTGYTGVALSNVERVVAAAADMLSQCPAYRGDWDSRSSDWTLFRIKASQALHDLKRFAEGTDYDASASQAGTYSRTAKQAQSSVPWFIYQRLISLYNFMIGDRDEIVANAQDWCEASIGLLVWWDEGRQGRQDSAGRPRHSQRAASRESDDSAYIQKMRKSFQTATSDQVTDLQVNTSDPIEVGLASLLEGDGESVIGFLCGWSGPISSAVAEIGSLAGWLPQSEPQSLMKMSLDEQDLMVLGISPSPSKSDSIKDKTLIIYAKALTHRGELKSRTHHGNLEPVEGWELAVSILGRLDSVARSEETVGEFLKGFKLDSPDTVDKLWRLLNNINMSVHAEKTAETYADSLAKDSYNYGEALWYYALAHKKDKVKGVLNLLISYSLICSVAYPPGSEMDDYLKRLMNSPRETISELSQLDTDAAQILHFAFTGYATLRSFYALRDHDFSLAKAGKTLAVSRARRSEAISCLLAIISSSNDNIGGGLYDEECGSVVSVDFLLALLGEALVFVNNAEVPLTVPDINILLKAIEDLQSVTPRVYSACTDFLQTVFASTQGMKGSTPADLLRKSTSNLSGTSSFSMVGSSMFASQLKQTMGSSGVLVTGNIKRGWDWRDMLAAGNTAEDLLRILRLGLAKKLASAWLAEVDNLL